MKFSLQEVIMLGIFLLALLTYLNENNPPRFAPRVTGYLLMLLCLEVSHPQVVSGEVRRTSLVSVLIIHLDF